MEVLGILDCKVPGVATLDCLPNVFPIIITWAITIAFIVALLLIIYSGFKFITSGGDEKQVEGARKTLTFAIAGLILVLASFFIVQFIAKQTKVGCLTTFSFDSCGGGAGTGTTPGSVSCSYTCRTNCQSNEALTSGTCTPTIGGNDRICCRPVRANGQPCTAHEQCRSGLCKPLPSGYCAAF